jgi:hypothetical protein
MESTAVMTLLSLLLRGPFGLGARMVIQAGPNSFGSAHDYQTVSFLNAALTIPNPPASASLLVAPKRPRVGVPGHSEIGWIDPCGILS